MTLHSDTEGDRTGQIFVYLDANNKAKTCMVGEDVPCEEYDLMPDYVKEHFTRQPPKRSKELKHNCIELDEHYTKQIMEAMKHAEESP